MYKYLEVSDFILKKDRLILVKQIGDHFKPDIDLEITR